MVNWSNWGRTHSCTPLSIEYPRTEEEIASIMKSAAAAGEVVKVVGSGHSFTDIAGTEGRMISLDRYRHLLRMDRETKRVTVEAGITINDLNEALDAAGLAMENLGDIGYQSIAGAIATATHGTGARLGNLATQVRALRLVLADSSTLDVSVDGDQQTFQAAQVSLGALGVISQVTLQCVDAFNLEAVVEPRPLDGVLESLDTLVDGNDHFEFFWFPHTDVCQVKINNRTDAEARPSTKTKEWIDRVLVENHAFGAVCRLGRLRESWIPGLSRAVTKGISSSRRVDRSYRVFVSPRLVRFAEMEYAIPRAAAAEALRRVRRLIDEGGFRISFPVEVRFVSADDIYLSPAHGRDTCYLAVHVFESMDYSAYFSQVEKVMNDYEGRPHWGKLHFQTAATLEARYPKWRQFAEVRSRLDPEGRFSNAYLGRVLESV